MNLFNLITNFVNDALGEPHFKSEKNKQLFVNTTIHYILWYINY